MKQYSYNIDGARYDVTIETLRDGMAEVNVNGVGLNVEILSGPLSESDLPDSTLAAPAPVSASVPPAGIAPSERTAAPEAAATGAGEGTPVKAPLPGVVTAINVTVGQKVKKGDTVAVLEAMKMENNITAEQDGTVTGIAATPGQSVPEGAVLVTIA
ncbi:MAG: biotin/lipoyl-binding protein [Bacteroidaceae bacterium]|nr:biotin/lipoyl-binding protein [Bacteroidaceae bacterium]